LFCPLALATRKHHERCRISSSFPLFFFFSLSLLPSFFASFCSGPGPLPTRTPFGFAAFLRFAPQAGGFKVASNSFFFELVTPFPFRYAAAPHVAPLRRYCAKLKRIECSPPITLAPFLSHPNLPGGTPAGNLLGDVRQFYFESGCATLMGGAHPSLACAFSFPLFCGPPHSDPLNVISFFGTPVVLWGVCYEHIPSPPPSSRSLFPLPGR